MSTNNNKKEYWFRSKVKHMYNLYMNRHVRINQTMRQVNGACFRALVFFY